MTRTEKQFILNFLKAEHGSHSRSIEHFENEADQDKAQKALGWHKARLSDIFAIVQLIKALPEDAAEDDMFVA